MSAFFPAFTFTKSRRVVNVIVAIYRDPKIAADAYRTAPNEPGAADKSLRVRNVVFTWTGSENRRLRQAIAHLR